MDSLLAGALTALAMVVIVAAAAVLITHFAMKGADSRHRAAVLESVAEVIRAIRGKR
ncbi:MULTISPECIES: hypothetical protein [Streptomyces]|uniref:hypothetical protein n=1 Tax=Streptomyces TaxID=1883 RepID=UPI0029A5A904|nr:hypothetical protein [Streptomyces europaeiscabiei]MDX3715791.1 hypothetical protein [Streptomyces europaeiscabiei]WSG19971.1 hypothetical protein OHB30_02160 [Streptomyces europaeiscabiei]